MRLQWKNWERRVKHYVRSKMIATRESYGNALAELGKEKENLVVLDADLAAATKTGIFKKAFPERHIDCGIAEANMTGIAAGLSTCGKVPFVSTFAMFAAGRAYEQVRNSIGYPHLNVKIGATHAGISVGEDGATHQCNEDIGLMREIPGMVIINPSDDVEAKAAVRGFTSMWVRFICVLDVWRFRSSMIIRNISLKSVKVWNCEKEKISRSLRQVFVCRRR